MSFLQNRKILIISPEPWSHIFVSKHHYAIELSFHKNKVYFLNPPGKGWSTKETNYKDLLEINYPGFWRGLRHLPLILRWINQKKVFRQIEKIVNDKIDVVWSFDNSVFYDFSIFPNNVFCISHIVDLNMSFQLHRAAKSASLCLCTTDQILKKLLKSNRRSFKINHGLSRTSFGNNDIELPGQNSLKAIYIGNLAMKYIDWNILYQACENADCDFIFIGPGGLVFDKKINALHRHKKSMKNLENVFFLPQIKSSEIHTILKKSDLLLIAYQEAHHGDQANPHKVMEYLASGKPIVATFTQEYEGLDLLYMSNKNEEWPSLLNSVVRNLRVYSNKMLEKKRIDFALDNKYSKQIERIDRIIEEKFDRPGL